MMTNNVNSTKMAVEDVVESTGKEFTAQSRNAFQSKPGTSLLDQSYNKQSPHEIGAKPLTGQVSTLLRDESKTTEFKPRKMKRRDIENEETNCGAKHAGLSSKTQKLGKTRAIMYAKQVCDAVENPRKLGFIPICAPKTNVQEMHIDSWKIPIHKPERKAELANRKTVLNTEAIGKSSVKPIAPVDTTKSTLSEAITVPGSPLEITSITDVEIEQSLIIRKKSKNLRKKIASGRTSKVDVSLAEFIDEINVSQRNETTYGAKPRRLNSTTQNSGKRRVKYTKLYELTEIPEKSRIQTCTLKTKINIEEERKNHERKPVVSIEVATIDTKVLNVKAVEESMVKPLAPVDTPKKEPILPITALGKLLEETTTVTEVDTKQSGHIAKISKNQRKKILRTCSRDVIAKESVTVKYIASEEKTNFSDKPKGLNSKPKQSGKSHIKYTKLYEITEIPEKPSIQTCTPKMKINIEETHINHERKRIASIDVAINETKVLDEKVVEESTVKPLAPVDSPKKESILPTTELGKLLEKTTADVTELKTQQSERTVKKSKNYRKKMSRLTKCSGEQ